MFQPLNLLCLVIISPMVAYILGAFLFSALECKQLKTEENKI